MLELGQPLHFYDAESLGNNITVRMAEDGEKLVTLDNIERELSKNDIAITDGKRAIGLAGVMGGLDTEVEETTKNIIIESAIFDSVKIRTTSNKILRSEASNRFEKGLDPARTYMAMERACNLLEKYADAQIQTGLVKYDVTDNKEKVIEITYKEINDVLGTTISKEDIVDVFRKLDFKTDKKEESVIVTVPTRRIDISIRADLIEEGGRIYGVDRRTAKKRYEGIRNKEKRVKPSKLDKYHEVIKEKIKIPGTNMKAIYKYILMNIDADIGSYSNFRKYVKKDESLLKEKENASHVLFETEPGLQLQFDWKGPMHLHTRSGKIIEFYIFSTTLGYSRFHTFIYSKFMTLESVERCLIESFEIIGGITKECLTDNMSSIFNYSKGNFSEAFRTFSKDIGFNPRHCRKEAPETKGKDESCNRFMNWLIPYDYEFEDEDELISVIKRLNNEINKEINQTFNMPPVVLFEKEKEYLQPLPKQIIIDQYIKNLIPVKVQNTQLIYYKGCRYSVPKKYINQTVKVKEIDNKLFVYYNKELIATHEISNKKINYKEEDYQEGLLSVLYKKEQEEIEQLAKKNLKLLERITK